MDKEITRRIAADLQQLGHAVWLDEWSIVVGQCIPTEIERALNDVEFIVLILSTHAVESEWVSREWKAVYWEEIDKGNILVLPVLIEDCARPPLLRTRKYADCRASYAVGLHELASAIDWHKHERATAHRTANTVCKDGTRSLESVTDIVDAMLIPMVQTDRPPTTAEIAQVIRYSISYGAAFYNAGRVEHCAKLYLHVASRLRELLQSPVPSGERGKCHATALKELSSALHETDSDTDATAWNVRRAFDTILADCKFEEALGEMDRVLNASAEGREYVSPRDLSYACELTMMYADKFIGAGMYEMSCLLFDAALAKFLIAIDDNDHYRFERLRNVLDDTMEQFKDIANMQLEEPEKKKEEARLMRISFRRLTSYLRMLDPL